MVHQSIRRKEHLPTGRKGELGIRCGFSIGGRSQRRKRRVSPTGERRRGCKSPDVGEGRGGAVTGGSVGYLKEWRVTGGQKKDFSWKKSSEDEQETGGNTKSEKTGEVFTPFPSSRLKVQRGSLVRRRGDQTTERIPGGEREKDDNGDAVLGDKTA